MSLKPIPDISNPDTAAKLGRLYVMREARRDALAQLRDAVGMLNSASSQAQDEGLALAREAVDRLEYVNKNELTQPPAPDVS